MRILFDVGHPGDFHALKNLGHALQAQGAEVLFTTRDKEFERELIKAEGFTFKSFGTHYKTIPGKIWGLLKFDLQMLWTALQFKPDLFISHGSIYASHASFVLRKKHMSLEDTGNMEQIRLYMPFVDVVLTPAVLPADLGPKQIRYNGYHEIAYLHPNVFKPDPSIFQMLNLAENEPFGILRFVSWNASHDGGQSGFSAEDKAALVKRLQKDMRVFISSEAELPEHLKPYEFKIAPEKLHDALYYASIVISEGATVASEAGVLGTPAIYTNTIPISYCQDQENYGLVFNTTESEKVFKLIEEILQLDREEFRKRRKILLEDKIDVNQFFLDFIKDRYLKDSKVLSEKRVSL